jgi:hypothetical protein
MNCCYEVCHKQLNYPVNFGLTFPILRDISGIDNESIKKAPCKGGFCSIQRVT